MPHHWITVPIDEAGDMKLKGYRTRAYMYGNFFYIEIGKSKMLRLWLGAIVHTNKDDVLFEIMFRHEGAENWTLCNPETIGNFFTELNVEGRTHFYDTVKRSSAKIVVLDDRKFGKRPYIRIDKNKPFCAYRHEIPSESITIDKLSFTILGDIIEDYGEWLALMLAFPKNIRHTSDAQVARQAFLDIRHHGPHVWSGYYESEIAKHRQLMAEYKRGLEEAEDNFIKLCERSASALDELSQRYGIEIDLSRPDNEVPAEGDW